MFGVAAKMNPVLSVLLRIVVLSIGLMVVPLPRRLELWLGPMLGRLLLRLDRKRRGIALENMRRCLPELGEDGHRELLERNYAHYGTLVFELAHLFAPGNGHYRRYAERISRMHGIEHWKEATAGGRGAIFFGGHMGNWEMMAAAGGLRGLRPTMVTRRVKPEWLRRKLQAARASVGVREAYDPRTLPAVMKALRNGESVGFVIDQYAPPPMGVPIYFFGTRVDTLAAVGPLANRTGAAVLPISARRDGNGIVHVSIEPELELGRDLGDPTRVAQALALKVESWIRGTPEQWLWIHRRFKNLSPAAPPAGR